MNKRLLFILLTVQSLIAADIPTVNVYVHGTQQFGSKLLPEDIWYCKQGLHHISHLPNSSMMVKDAQLLQEGDALNFDLDHYYTFGWSGTLGFAERAQAGNELYNDLKNLLQKYKQQHDVYPKLRITTFSHGGNVALNMVKHLPFVDDEKIELELVLIGCPVQKTTEYLIDHPCISQSCVIYSTFDLLQVADYYNYNGVSYFPTRTFDTKSKNCFQILVTVNNSRLCHIELCHAFMRHVPKVLRSTLRKEPGSALCYQYDIKDSGFVFYWGYNMFSVLQSARK